MSDVYMSEVEESLAHFGVKGMRWGVRRENKGGSSSGKVEEAKPKLPASEDFTKTRASQAKGPDALSTKELQELVTRMNLEQQYSKLLAGPEVKKGKSFAEKALENYAQETTKKLIGTLASAAGKALLNVLLGKYGNEIPSSLVNVMKKMS